MQVSGALGLIFGRDPHVFVREVVRRFSSQFRAACNRAAARKKLSRWTVTRPDGSKVSLRLTADGPRATGDGLVLTVVAWCVRDLTTFGDELRRVAFGLPRGLGGEYFEPRGFMGDAGNGYEPRGLVGVDDAAVGITLGGIVLALIPVLGSIAVAVLPGLIAALPGLVEKISSTVGNILPGGADDPPPPPPPPKKRLPWWQEPPVLIGGAALALVLLWGRK